MAEFRKTKIVCTLGPAVDDRDTIAELLKAGMNIARFNFSHGDHEEHRGRVAKLREASAQTGIPVALLLDTKGPEIRTGSIKDGGTIDLPKGHEITLTTDEVEGTNTLLSISYNRSLPRSAPEGIFTSPTGSSTWKSFPSNPTRFTASYGPAGRSEVERTLTSRVCELPFRPLRKRTSKISSSRLKKDSTSLLLPLYVNRRT